MEKSELRTIYRNKRLDLSLKEVESRSKLIADNLINNLLPKISKLSSKKMAFYLPIQNEVDPSFIFNYFAKTNIISLPRIVKGSKVLEFRKYSPGDKLEKNFSYRNIVEPKLDNEVLIPDLIFTPLVAFDKNCYRLGMGGGFYDATINFFRATKIEALFIGLAYQIQEFREIPTIDLDKKLDFIVCENEIFSCL